VEEAERFDDVGFLDAEQEQESKWIKPNTKANQGSNGRCGG
jgi:hypothetical protein